MTRISIARSDLAPPALALAVALGMVAWSSVASAQSRGARPPVCPADTTYDAALGGCVGRVVCPAGFHAEESLAQVVSAVNVAGYLTGAPHELEFRVDATTPLPFRPAILELCTDGSGLPCPRAATVPVGGYVRFLITLQNLSERSLQRFIDALEDPRDM